MIWGLAGLLGVNPLSQVVSTFIYADIMQHRYEWMYISIRHRKGVDLLFKSSFRRPSSPL